MNTLSLPSPTEGQAYSAVQPEAENSELRAPYDLLSPDNGDDDLIDEVEEPAPVHWRRRLCIGASTTLILAVAAILLVYFLTKHGPAPPPPSPWQAACSVFCQGPILEAVQSARLWVRQALP
jgi:hypothetical protein